MIPTLLFFVSFRFHPLPDALCIFLETQLDSELPRINGIESIIPHHGSFAYHFLIALLISKIYFAHQIDQGNRDRVFLLQIHIHAVYTTDSGVLSQVYASCQSKAYTTHARILTQADLDR